MGQFIELMSYNQKGRPKSASHRQRISEGLHGNVNVKGKHINVGPDNPNWIDDRSLVKHRQNRNNPEYKQWRQHVWLRDAFGCKIASTDCKGKIEAHHILAWHDYPELRYQITNGITLCHAHHPRRRAEEKRLAADFQRLVSVSKAPLFQHSEHE